jgi:hypothetical protein
MCRRRLALRNRHYCLGQVFLNHLPHILRLRLIRHQTRQLIQQLHKNHHHHHRLQLVHQTHYYFR